MSLRAPLERLASSACLLLLLVACAREAPEPEAASEAVAASDTSQDAGEPAMPPGQEPLPEVLALEVSVEGEVEAREATLARSPQGYAIYVLPQIEFTPEEPGRDVAFARVDDRFFVRVERLDPAAPLLAMRADAELELSALGPVEVVTGSALQDPFFQSADFFLQASSAELTKLIVVLPIEGVRYRFSLHLPLAEAAEGIVPSFWAMLRSIRTVGEPEHPGQASSTDE